MNTARPSKKLRVRNGIAVLLFIYVMNYLVALVFVGKPKLECFCRPHFHEKFDHKLWQISGSMGRDNRGRSGPPYGARYRMVDELLTSNLLLGMGRDQVNDLLGWTDAGILDKEYFTEFPRAPDVEPTKAEKEILGSTDKLTFCYYHLGYQDQFPAASFWYPLLFDNHKHWKFFVKIKNGRVIASEVVS